MKILLTGLGSIGQRHARILKDVVGDSLELYAYRKRNLNIVINDDMTATEGVSPLEHYGITPVASLEEAMEMDLSAVFITNPISMHVETALKAAQNGHSFFIEKPLCDSLTDVDQLLSTSQKKNLTTFVGYQMRFHPNLMRMRELLLDGTIGAPLFSDIHFGEWLPGMHPYEDYRESHASRADQGGGAILCLSHEIDLAYWLFGMPQRICSAGGQISSMEMNTEDSADLLLDCTMNDRLVPVHIHLDFLQRPARRYTYIVGEKGSLYWDYYANSITIHSEGSNEPRVEVLNDFKRNIMFYEEVRNFVESNQENKPSAIPLEEGIDVLKICLAAKESLQSKQSVFL